MLARASSPPLYVKHIASQGQPPSRAMARAKVASDIRKQWRACSVVAGRRLTEGRWLHRKDAPKKGDKKAIEAAAAPASDEDEE